MIDVEYRHFVSEGLVDVGCHGLATADGLEPAVDLHLRTGRAPRAGVFGSEILVNLPA